MDDFQRHQVATLVDRLNDRPARLILVSGPRQTGKTTIVLQALEHIERPHTYIAVDEPYTPHAPVEDEPHWDSAAGQRDSAWIARNWTHARLRTERSGQGFILVFDEIQNIPNWSNTVKGLWDADRRNGTNLHVVILGSAPLLMQRGTSESLAGRFETIQVTHWSFAEMKDAFDFDLPQYLYFGGYPGAAAHKGDNEQWRDYITNALVEPHIERDILAMERVDKPILLKRLFELSAEFSGQILSYSKMLGQLDDAGNTTTLARYLHLLERSGLVVGLMNYEGKWRRLRSSSPKLNVLNTALMTALSSYSFEEAQSDRTFWGRLVETAVGAHLFNTSQRGTRMDYWRYRDREVDFVVQRGPHVIAIEVKSGARRHGMRGLNAFEKKFKGARHLLIGDDGIPIEEFLSHPAEHWIGPP